MDSVATIDNVEDYQNTLLKNVIAALLVWDDSKKLWIPYFFRKTFKKESKVKDLKTYRGSSKGKNKANPKIIKAIDESSKPPRINIISHNVSKGDLGTLEQKAVMEFNFPYGGHHVDSDCFNEKYPTDGIPEDQMRSNIAADRLREKIKKHKDSNDPFEFPTGFSEKDFIHYLKYEKLFVQSRWEKEGSKESVAYYARKMGEKPFPDQWQGHLFLLMPQQGSNQPIGTGSNHNPRILDGNQSSEACLRVPDMPGLNDIRIPYEDHYLINETDLEAIGNELNAKPEVQQDHTDDNDILRSIKNTLIANNLFTKKRPDGTGGNPKVDHYIVDKLFPPLNLSDNLIKFYKNTIKKECADAQKEEMRQQKGYYDFSVSALNANEGNNGNRRQWDIVTKDFDRKKYDLVHIFRQGMPEKISLRILGYKKENGKWPKNVLSFMTPEMEKRYQEEKNKVSDWKDVIHNTAVESEVTIVIVSPVGEEYTKITKDS